MKLHAFARQPGARAHLAIHAGDVAAGGEHQRDGVLGDRDVAIALDGVDADAARLELGDIHVARSPGAEKDDVLERSAAAHEFGRQIGMIVDADVIALQQPRQLGCSNFERLTTIGGSSGRTHTLPHRRELIVAIDEQGFFTTTGDSLARGEREATAYHRATMGFAARTGSRGATPGNAEPSSNQDAGAGWPHSVCRCGSVSDQRIGA